MSEDSDPRRKRRFFGRGALTSLLVHGAILFPLITLAFVLGAREAEERDREVAMTFDEVDPQTLPPDLPPIDPQLPQPPPPPPVEPLVQQPPPPPEEQPPPPPEEKPPEQQRAEDLNKKSVDFQVEKEEEPAPNAQFLAEKNSRAEQETRADRTNLEKETKGEKEASSPSDRKDQTPGDEEDRIAQTEDREGNEDRNANEKTRGDRSARPDSPSSEQDRRSLLTLRGGPKRQHQVTPETSFPELPRDPEGVMPLPPENLESMRDLEGTGGPRPPLRVTAEQYKALFGDDADAAAEYAKKRSTKKGGRFTQHLARMQSAYENFIPEVKPGNQTALNARAAPFAAFIARMHRSIHERWGFGFLVDLESKPASNPLNNRQLFTKLEIVLAGDGTVDKVTIIKPSGQLPFDSAAIDTVYSSGPYSDPPASIRSGNGKIYVHWTFHRDERQCATSGVNYYILDNGPGKAGGGAPAPPAGREPEADRRKRG
ncbi:MAG TPA: TonB C-terminal domain-containing protein [Polyangia bacterium]